MRLAESHQRSFASSANCLYEPPPVFKNFPGVVLLRPAEVQRTGPIDIGDTSRAGAKPVSQPRVSIPAGCPDDAKPSSCRAAPGTGELFHPIASLPGSGQGLTPSMDQPYGSQQFVYLLNGFFTFDAPHWNTPEINDIVLCQADYRPQTSDLSPGAGVYCLFRLVRQRATRWFACLNLVVAGISVKFAS